MPRALDVAFPSDVFQKERTGLGWFCHKELWLRKRQGVICATALLTQYEDASLWREHRFAILP